MKPTSRPNGEAASANITKRIEELGDWRGETLAHVRQLIHDADPDIEEEWKWVKPTNPGTPVWSRDGIVCTGESYKEVVKLTFARGASLDDPEKLFNSSLEGNVRRAIDIHEGEKINEAALKDLIRAAVALNLAGKSKSKGKSEKKRLNWLNFMRNEAKKAVNVGNVRIKRNFKWKLKRIFLVLTNRKIKTKGRNVRSVAKWLKN